MNTTTATTAAAPKMTKAGRVLMALIGQHSFSFFDEGITADSGIWHECLTAEAAGRPGLPATARGVKNVIKGLADAGLLTVSDNDEDGEWVSLTESGAETANALTAALSPEAPEEVPAAPAKLPSAAEMRKAIVATGELTRDQARAHKGGDLEAAYRNLVLSAQEAPKTSSRKKAAAKPAAEKPAAKDPKAPKDDAVTRHITEVFSKLPSGSFLTFREIINATSKEFPKADGDRPGTNAVYSRCHGGRLPAGLTGQNKPCGATKN